MLHLIVPNCEFLSRDSVRYAGQMRLLLILIPISLVAETIALPPARARHPYSAGPLAAAEVDGCTRPIPGFHLVNGALPEGVRLMGGGYLRGQPARAGEYRFTIEVNNGCSPVRRSYTLSVRGAAVLEVAPRQVELTVVKVGNEALAASGKVSMRLIVGSDWPGLAYTLTADAGWVGLEPLRGRTAYPGEALAGDPVSVEIDARSLPPGEHRTTIRVTSQHMAEPVTVPVLLVVR